MAILILGGQMVPLNTPSHHIKDENCVQKLNIESGSTAHEGPNQKSGSVTNRDMVWTNQERKPHAQIL